MEGGQLGADVQQTATEDIDTERATNQHPLTEENNVVESTSRDATPTSAQNNADRLRGGAASTERDGPTVGAQTNT